MIESDLSVLLSVVEWTSLISLISHSVGAVGTAIILVISFAVQNIRISESFGFISGLAGTVTDIFGTIALAILLLNIG